MSRKRWVLFLAVIVIAVAFMAFWHRAATGDVPAIGGTTDQAASMQANSLQAMESVDMDARPDVQGDPGKLRFESDFTPDLRQRFRESTDYAAFIASILSDARAGDRDAQYYVSAALAFCDAEFRALFRKRDGSRWLTRDEGMTRAANWRWLPSGYVEEVDQKCRVLIEGTRPELGGSVEWLEKSANQGQPIALSVRAGSELLGRNPEKDNETTLAKARDALLVALRSGDPEVLWRIGELQGALNDMSDESTKSQWAWWLAACERGFDCGPDSPWRRFSCVYDQLCRPDETMREYAQRHLQTDFPAAEELAREIDAKIEAEAWSDIDIGG